MPTAPVYGRPGVYVIEQLIGPSPSPQLTSPSNAGFAGEHWCGIPGVAVRCNSWADFTKFFGGFNASAIPALANPYLPYEVYEFFLNGGTTAFVNRIAGSATPGSAASTTLSDSAATPQNTLTLTAGALGKAGNIGTWGNNLFVDISAQNNANGRFNMTVYNGAHTAAAVVETWTDMSMAKTDPRYAVAMLNSPTAGSNFLFATDLNDVSAFPLNAPASVSGKTFSGGTDCSDPSITDRSTAMTSGTCPFDYVPGPLTINMPGESSTTVLTAAITYAQTRQSSFLVVDPPSGLTPLAAIAFFQSLSPVSGYAAMYYPWQNALNPASNTLSNSILLPPGGFVLGQMVRMDNTKGVWWAPAGASTVLAGVTSPERSISPTDGQSLNQANVNYIRQRGNGQIVIWGTRTMQSGYATLYVPVRRTLNYIESYLSGALESMVFAPNDPASWTQIQNICNSFLAGLLSAGAFPTTSADTSYFVVCDATNNTPQSIQQGILNVTVGLALQIPAEFIVLLMQQFEGSVSTTVASAA